MEREEHQEVFVSEVRDWTAGVYTAGLSSTQELRDAVTRALHELELSRQAGPSMRRRCSGEPRNSSPSIADP
jgi:hypothetical protein